MNALMRFQMERKIGAHLSIGEGYNRALEKIFIIGGNCLQIFSVPPRYWTFADLEEEQMKSFVYLKEKLAVDPVYFHASYLINLADNGRVGALSKQSLIAELNLAAEMGVRGSVIHLGSFKDRSNRPAFDHERYELFLENIREVLRATPEETFFIIENAGMRKIGKTIEEIEEIIKDLNNERVKVCLDTCHLFSTGYDIGSRKKLDKFLDNFDKRIGLDKLELWHLNDSRDPLGSFRDRHQNIGEGEMGLDVFRLLLNHPKTKNLPFIIETPGFDKSGPDKKNIDTLKNLIEE